MKVLQNFRKFRVLWYGRTELTEVPGGYKRCGTRTAGYCGTGCTELTEIPGTGMNVLQKTNRSSGTGMKVLQNFQKFRVVRHGCPELLEVPGTGTV